MNERARLRIRFAKLGKIRWTSHRDLARMWERAFRRANLALAYSGFFRRWLIWNRTEERVRCSNEL